MALTCARCATQNPDRNAFCQACGTAVAMSNDMKESRSRVGPNRPGPPPAATPSPLGHQTPGKSAATTASSSAVSVNVPPGWVATTKDPVVQVTNPAGSGTIVMSSGTQTPQSAPQMKDSADQSLTNQPPDIKTCPNTKTTSGTDGGVAGPL